MENTKLEKRSNIVQYFSYDVHGILTKVHRPVQRFPTKILLRVLHKTGPAYNHCWASMEILRFLSCLTFFTIFLNDASSFFYILLSQSFFNPTWKVSSQYSRQNSSFTKLSMPHVKFFKHSSDYYEQLKYFQPDYIFISRIFYCVPLKVSYAKIVSH